MSTGPSDKHWRRILYSYVSFWIILLLFLAIASLELLGDVGIGISGIMFMIALGITFFGGIDFITKDKSELSSYIKDFEYSNYEKIKTVLFIMMLNYLYIAWYIYWRKRKVSSWEQKRSDTETSISKTRSKMNKVIESLDASNLTDAEQELKDIKSDIQSTMETTSQHNFKDLTSELKELSQQRQESLEKAEDLRREQQSQQIKNKIDTLQADFNQAHLLVEKGELNRAQSALESLMSSIESAEMAATRYHIDDLYDELSNLEQECEDLFDQLTEKQQHQQLQNKIQTLNSTLDQTETLLERYDFKKAKTELNELEPKIKSAKETTVQFDFEDLNKELIMLEEQRENRLELVYEQLGEDQPPSAIPHTTNMSVEYNELINRKTIGEGGNADVTKATLPTPDGAVTLAIKEPRITGTIHTEAVSQMLKEAETWNKLSSHDYIVNVIDFGSEPIPWIAMEYMDAGHLGEQSGELEFAQALWTAIAVAKGVRHAHRRGVAHLDLKPENILFRSVNDAWDVPKVADWGLSKHLINDSKSVEGLSPQYAAPEQFDDEFGPVDDITDIYQLGAVFYELFTGQPPFSGKPARAMHKVLHEQPQPPTEVADVPAELDEILLTALAKERYDRYDNIVYLRDKLKHLHTKF